MIVLRRKPGQGVHIGHDIRIIVKEVKVSKSVQLGIDAPASIPVHRLEIYEKIRLENRAATRGDALGWLRRARNET